MEGAGYGMPRRGQKPPQRNQVRIELAVDAPSPKIKMLEGLGFFSEMAGLMLDMEKDRCLRLDESDQFDYVRKSRKPLDVEAIEASKVPDGWEPEAWPVSGVEPMIAYLPFHATIRSWGMHISPGPVLKLAKRLVDSGMGIKPSEAIVAALAYNLEMGLSCLSLECAASRLEGLLRQPLYCKAMRESSMLHPTKEFSKRAALLNLGKWISKSSERAIFELRGIVGKPMDVTGMLNRLPEETAYVNSGMLCLLALVADKGSKVPNIVSIATKELFSLGVNWREHVFLVDDAQTACMPFRMPQRPPTKEDVWQAKSKR